MREAVGSSWLFYLIITFLLIYVFFMGFVMNYASTYRAANYVVTQIENCQAQNEVDCAGNDLGNIIKDIRAKYHYILPNGSDDQVICCIDNGTNSSVYRVNLPVAFEVPMLGPVKWISVKAETKTIQKISCGSSGFSRCK